MIRSSLLVLAAVVAAPAARAAPVMARLGYANCVACHHAPQGGGPLTDYGRGVDEAQSLRAGEYQPSERPWVRALNLEGRVRHDVRLLGQGGATSAGDFTWLARALYRNATSIGENHRLSLVVGAEVPAARLANLAYSTSPRPGNVFVSQALWSYRPHDGLEIALGRDALPSGLNLADVAPFYRARNRQFSNEYPTQLKLFSWSQSGQLTGYLFGPSGHEPRREREFGGGALAERDFGGEGKLVLGLDAQVAASELAQRLVAGGYARLGFDTWGVFAVHDTTVRRVDRGSGRQTFGQFASYLQVFVAAREWLIPSLAVEHLFVQEPFPEHRVRVKPEVAIRLTSNVSLLFNVRADLSPTTGQRSIAGGAQLALKTVD